MFGFLVGVVGFIVGLFQGGIDAIVTFLAWAVAALQAGAILLWNAIKGALDLTRLGFIKSWDFLGSLYDDVLKPAWDKFWRWFDRLRSWLNDTFGPVLQWLRDLRTELLHFWATYVRPWLDLIDVTRKLLRTLASLGLTWARALDQRLAAIESAIEAPFLFVLGKLNEIINVVNAVVGKDGLLQRVALIRSIARDYRYVWNAITLPYLKNQATPTAGATDALDNPKSLDAVADDTRAYWRDESGALAGAVNEAAAQFAIYLRS
jgi:hypothetical protein